MTVSDKTRSLSEIGEFLPQVLESADQSLSFTRDIFLAAMASRIQDDSLKPFSFVGVGLGLGLGSYEIKKARESYFHAKEISDKETIQRAQARFFSGTIITSGALISLVEKVSQIFTTSVAPICALWADIFFGIGAVFAMGMSGLGIYRCARFLSRLNQQKSSESTLQFLLETATTKWKNGETQEQFMRRAEAKMNYFKRRASSRAYQLLVVYRKSKGEALEELIQETRSETKKKIVLFSISLIAAAVALTAIFLGVFVSSGPAPFVLFAVSSSVYLGLGFYSVFGKKDDPHPDFRDNLPIST